MTRSVSEHADTTLISLWGNVSGDTQTPLLRKSPARANGRRFLLHRESRQQMVIEKQEEGSNLMSIEPAFLNSGQQLNIYLCHVGLHPLTQHMVTRKCSFLSLTSSCRLTLPFMQTSSRVIIGSTQSQNNEAFCLKKKKNYPYLLCKNWMGPQFFFNWILDFVISLFILLHLS